MKRIKIIQNKKKMNVNYNILLANENNILSLSRLLEIYCGWDYNVCLNLKILETPAITLINVEDSKKRNHLKT